MKMKNLSKFLCLVALMFIGQSAWAAAGDKTPYQISWSHSNLNSLSSGVFSKQSDNGLINVTMSGEYSIWYRDDWDIDEYVSKGVGRLVMGDQEDGTTTHTLSWAASQTGYSLTAAEVGTLVRSYGAGKKAWLKLGAEAEVQINWAVYDATTHVTTSNIAATATSVPMVFRRNAALKREYNMTKLQLNMYITPDAPTWNTEADDVLVTVNHTQDAYLHWIDLNNYIQVANSAFAGTVKYEAIGLDAKYIVWNSTHDRCYIVKPGTYQFRAYIDKKDGAYCASAYTATNLELTATAESSEQSVAQVFYFVDDVMATEYDKANHYWTVDIPWTSENKHYVEYVYAYPGTYQFIRQTTHGIQYLSDTDPASDHFNVLCSGTMDTTEIKIDGAHHSWLEINAKKASNHVTFTINSQTMYDALATSWSTQEGTDVFWDNNRIRFAHFNDDYYRKRQLEITFTGVPDSLIMLYGNNSEWQSSNAAMEIEYCVKGSWSTLTTINGRPNSAVDEHVRFAFRVPAGANQLRFSYSGAQNLAFIHDLTVTERKGIEMSVAMDSVLEFSGVRQKGGLDIKYPTLSWYNLYPTMHDTLVNYNPDRFEADLVGLKPLMIDDFEEDHPVSLALKLDSAGVFNTHFMVWNGRSDMSGDIPGGKKVYGFLMHGIVKYGDKDLHLENTLPSDTISMNKGDLLDNPFQVKDSFGNIITDSLHYNYEFFPADAAEIDPETGKIKANCVGYTRVIATLKENKLIPGGVTDTIFIYVAETKKNEIIWSLPEQIGRRDILTNVAATADSAAITYHFLPVEMATYKGNNTIQIADTIGEMYITATAGQTCDHMKMDSTVKVTILDIIEDENFVVKDPGSLRNLLPGDSIKDLVVIIDPQTGDTILPPYVQTTYRFEPEDAAKVVDGNIIVVSHAVDILCIATTTGLNIKTRVDSIWLRVGHDWEEIEFTDKMLDTMLVGTEYILSQYITTMSGQGVDSLYCLPAKAYFNQAKHSIKPQDSAYVELFAIAKGNADFWGPDTASHMVHFVYGVQDINWEDLGDLSDLRVKDDTIRTSDIPVKDNKGNDITNQVTKEYEFQPEGLAHVTEDGDLVMDQAGDVTVIITTSGPGFETKKDTLYMHADGYQVAYVVLPEDLNYLHVGDSVSLAGTKVYDQDGKDITDTKVDAITYSVVPSDAAVIDPETGKLVVLKADSFQLICNVFGAEIVPSPTSVADTLGVLIYDEVEVIFPSDDVLKNARPGDTIPGVRIQDQDKDITDLATIKYTFEPDSMAHVDEDGNIIIDHAGDLKIKVEVTGEGLKDTTQEKSANINPYTVGEVVLPTIGNNNHVGDTIDMSNVKVLDEDGKDISEYATITYSFEPDSAAHVDPKTGNIIIDKSGNVKIVATISGNDVAPYSDDVEFFVKKYQTSDIILPEHQGEDYEPGDKIEKGDIQVLDKDGNDISDKSTITMTWEPADAAHLDSKGNLVFDKPGQIKVTTTISGEGVETMSKDTVYIIRHSEKGCKNLIAQVWDDVLAVNNNKETHVKMGIEQFVSYQWYREEEKLAGETAQDYHISAGEFKGDAYFYAYAYDINGKEYLLCEILVNETAQPAASSSFKIYPNMVAAHGKYTVEVAQAGTINITNSNGNAIESYQVSKGMTDKMAPAAPGVYMLQYVPAEGKYEVLKLIVK